nr:immunoglobulin light chain junction region [Macaca mulatta]MOW42808.1 immunoglobulin light chain junction region [Macaca mulatta]MOW45026.1 immunoglobulin light chain junction region [Macaca mulatta]MOW45384.1 immunoglobulin light chain junction region [Macaca mulatta]
CQHYNSDPRTF